MFFYLIAPRIPPDLIRRWQETCFILCNIARFSIWLVQVQDFQYRCDVSCLAVHWGSSWCPLEPFGVNLEAVRGHLRGFEGHLRVSWEPPGGLLEASWGPLRASWESLGGSWGLLGWSWGLLGWSSEGLSPQHNFDMFLDRFWADLGVQKDPKRGPKRSRKQF